MLGGLARCDTPGHHFRLETVGKDMYHAYTSVHTHKVYLAQQLLLAQVLRTCTALHSWARAGASARPATAFSPTCLPGRISRLTCSCAPMTCAKPGACRSATPFFCRGKPINESMVQSLAFPLKVQSSNLENIQCAKKRLQNSPKENARGLIASGDS